MYQWCQALLNKLHMQVAEWAAVSFGLKEYDQAIGLSILVLGLLLFNPICAFFNQAIFNPVISVCLMASGKGDASHLLRIVSPPPLLAAFKCQAFMDMCVMHAGRSSGRGRRGLLCRNCNCARRIPRVRTAQPAGETIYSVLHINVCTVLYVCMQSCTVRPAGEKMYMHAYVLCSASGLRQYMGMLAALPACGRGNRHACTVCRNHTCGYAATTHLPFSLQEVSVFSGWGAGRRGAVGGLCVRVHTVRPLVRRHPVCHRWVCLRGCACVGVLAWVCLRGCACVGVHGWVCLRG